MTQRAATKPLVAVLALALLAVCASATYFRVDPNTEHCFLENLVEGTRVGLVFQVVDGGALDIDLEVRPRLPFPSAFLSAV